MAKKAQLDAVRPVLNALDAEASAAEHVVDAVVANADKATEVIEHGLEKAVDVVPEVLDKSVHVAAGVAKRSASGIRNPKVALLVISLSGAAAGVAVGIVAYKLQKKRIEKIYEDRLQKELDEMRHFYIMRDKKGEFSTPRSAAEALQVEEAVEALKEYRAEETKDATPEPKAGKDDRPFVQPVVEADPDAASKNQKIRYDKAVTDTQAAQAIREGVVSLTESGGVVEDDGTVKRNVFVNGSPIVDDDWDAEAEEALRNPEVPYVISQDEYMENNFEHPQHSLIYYKADDVLVDDQQHMIEDVESLVTSENLVKFGHGSRDANIVYIRNERIEADFEVALHQGSFSEEVMGLRHSDDTSGSFRKARWGDNE